jgi:F-type H+-transporting ATPase subunit b
MPQLAQLALVYQSQWFWLAVTLAAIFFLAGRGIVPKVEETVDRRDAQIARDLAEAERLRTEADAAEEAWRSRMNEAHATAQASLAESKASAARDAEQRVHAADEAITAKVEAASAALAEAREQAWTQIQSAAADATRDIVAKLTGATVTEATAKAAVAEALTHA